MVWGKAQKHPSVVQKKVTGVSKSRETPFYNLKKENGVAKSTETPHWNPEKGKRSRERQRNTPLKTRKR